MSIFTGCSKDDEPDLPDNQGSESPSDKPEEDDNGATNDPENPDIKSSRTVLIYMVADNSLGKGHYDESDMKEIDKAVKDGALGESGRLLIYYNRPGTASGSTPILVEATTDAQWPVLKQYPDDVSIYSTDASRMCEVLEDVRKIAPSDDYGVIFWSHSTGWMDENAATTTISYQLPVLRSYGDDRHQRMAIPVMASVLEKFDHSFIYFDCCMMATVEVMYELRHAAPIIAASGAEVHGEGMPYDITLPYFFSEGKADIVGVADATYKYYNGRSGVDRWSTQSVIDTEWLDNLAAVTRLIMENGGLPGGTMNDYQSYTPSTRRYRIFDMADYIDGIDGIAPELRALWEEALSQAVTYKANTPMVNGSHRIARYCGLGCNILFDRSEIALNGYNRLAWWADVISHNPSYD